MTRERLGSLTPLRHAYLAKLLIKACGGLIEAAAACRVEKTQLGYFQDAERVQDPDRCQFMPADVIADLEAYCGQALYSKELFEARPSSFTTESMMDEALQALKSMTDVVAQIGAAHADGVVTPAERKVIEQLLVVLTQRLARISASNGEGT